MSEPCKHWFEGMVARSETACPFCEIERLQNFESDAKRLALELECLLMSCDLPAATKWWDSAHEALELHRKTIGQYYGEKL